MVTFTFPKHQGDPLDFLEKYCMNSLDKSGTFWKVGHVISDIILINYVGMKKNIIPTARHSVMVLGCLGASETELLAVNVEAIHSQENPKGECLNNSLRHHVEADNSKTHIYFPFINNFIQPLIKTWTGLQSSTFTKSKVTGDFI